MEAFTGQSLVLVVSSGRNKKVKRWTALESTPTLGREVRYENSAFRIQDSGLRTMDYGTMNSGLGSTSRLKTSTTTTRTTTKVLAWSSWVAALRFWHIIIYIIYVSTISTTTANSVAQRQQQLGQDNFTLAGRETTFGQLHVSWALVCGRKIMPRLCNNGARTISNSFLLFSFFLCFWNCAWHRASPAHRLLRLPPPDVLPLLRFGQLPTRSARSGPQKVCWETDVGKSSLRRSVSGSAKRTHSWRGELRVKAAARKSSGESFEGGSKS